MIFSENKTPFSSVLKLLSGLFVVSAFMLMHSHGASAVSTCTFASVGTTAWSTAANWDCGAVPTSTTIVIVPAATTTALSTTSLAGTLTVGAGATITASTYALTVAGATDNTGVVTSTTGTLTFTGAVTNNAAGIIASNTGNIMFGSTLGNAGILDIGAGVATSTGNLTNTGTIFGRTGRLELVANYSGAGTFTAGTGTVRLYGVGTQSIKGETFYNFVVLKTSGVASIATANATVGGTLTTSGGGTLSAVAQTLTVTGATTIGSGTTVTSTSGDLTFAAVTNSGSLGTVSGNQILASMTNGGTWELGAESTSTGSVVNTGTILLRNQTLHVGSHWTDTAGTLTPGTGTVNFYNSAGDQYIYTEPNFYNLTITKTANSVLLGGNVTVTNNFTAANGGTTNAVTFNLTVAGALSVGAGTTVTSTTGTMTFTGAASNAGSIGSVSGNMLFGSTLANSGALVIGSGVATSTGSLTNTGTIAGNTGKLVYVADYSGAGTFTANTGTVTLYGTAAQAIKGGTFYNLEMRKASNTATINTTNPTVGGTLNTYGGGKLTVAALNLAVTGATSIGTGSTVTSTTGDMTFGAVTNVGNLGTVSGNFVMSSLTNSGTVNVNAQSTSTGAVTNTGTLRLNGNTLHVGGNWNGTSGTLTPGAGTVDLNGTGAQAIGPEANFYNLTVDKTAGTATLVGNVTTTRNLTITDGTLALDSYTLFVGYHWTDSGTFDGGTGTVEFNGTAGQNIGTEANFYGLTINKASGVASMTGHVSTTNLTVTNGTLAVDDKILYAPGTYNNDKLVTVTSGDIKHDADQIAFVNSSGVAQTSYTTPASVYLQVEDQNINMSATNTESFTVAVAVNAAGGSDTMSSITLTETAIGSGIFRSAAIPLYSTVVVRPGTSELEISSSGTGTLTYTDAQDATDTGTGTVSMVYAATASSGGTGGGGGGGGVSSPVTTYQSSQSDPNRAANLANLATKSLSINSLVKLPDDGKLETQEDSAVYFIGSDGKRHAFPNSKIYFTWYASFDGVVVISADVLASVPLGSNARYKPGTRMIKFTTDPKVYAIDTHGILRWVKTEEAATSLYGGTWNTKIDDMSDAFFGNYTFGSDVSSGSDFSPATATQSVGTISADYGW